MSDWLIMGSYVLNLCWIFQQLLFVKLHETIYKEVSTPPEKNLKRKRSGIKGYFKKYQKFRKINQDIYSIECKKVFISNIRKNGGK